MNDSYLAGVSEHPSKLPPFKRIEANIWSIVTDLHLHGCELPNRLIPGSRALLMMYSEQSSDAKEMVEIGTGIGIGIGIEIKICGNWRRFSMEPSDWPARNSHRRQFVVSVELNGSKRAFGDYASAY